MKKNRSSNDASVVMPLQPFGVQHYYNHLHTDPWPERRLEEPDDEYDHTLLLTAARLGAHGERQLNLGDPTSAAGLFRDAARLADLLRERQSARVKADQARRSQRRKAARS